MTNNPDAPPTPHADPAIALGELQGRFDALLRASFEGLAISVDGVIVEANEALTRIIGREHDDLVGRHVLELCPPAVADEVLARIRSGDERPYEALGLRADGTAFEGEVHGKNATWRGQPARVTAFREIGWRKAAERRLEASAARFRDLADLLPAIILESEDAGYITFINRYGTELLGYDGAELLGTPVLHLIDPVDHARARANFARRVAGESLPPRQYTFVRRDGTRFCGEVRASLVLEGGRPIGGRSVVIDLTERIAAEQARLDLERRVEQAQRLESLGLLAGGVAHDFNNLLAVMLGNVELALLELDGAAPVRRYVEGIGAASRRAAEMVRQLLAYAGRAPIEVGRVDLNAVAVELVELLEIRAAGRARLELSLAPDLPHARGDAAQLSQVVMNLVTNAIEAHTPGVAHVVRVATRQVDLDATRIAGTTWVTANGAVDDQLTLAPGTYVALAVSDSGAGIPADVRRRMFEPFFSTKQTGRGLGLAAVLGILRGHGGAIAVTSEQGLGARFEVFVPVASPPDDGAPAATAEPPPPIAAAALVIDDQEPVARLIKLLLRRLGLEVTLCLDSGDAERAFQARPGGFDLVVLDVIMPGRSGLETLRALRQVAPEVPVVVCSGYAEDEARDGFEGERVAAFVQKPFDLDALRGAVARALKDRGAVAE